MTALLGATARLRRHSGSARRDRAFHRDPAVRAPPDPAGRLTPLGNLPTGGRPHTNGRFLWALSTGRGRNDVRSSRWPKSLPQARKGKKGSAAEAKQTGSKKCNRRAGKPGRPGRSDDPVPGLSGGIAMSRDGRTAYVSGLADSSHTGEQVDSSVPGRQGDVIHVLRYDPSPGSRPGPGSSRCLRPAVPRTSRTSRRVRGCTFRGRATSRSAQTARTLIVSLNLADSAALIDTRTGMFATSASATTPTEPASRLTANTDWSPAKPEGRSR